MLELGTQYTYYLFTLVGKMISSTFEKMTKYNLRIISKQYAHLQTMT